MPGAEFFDSNVVIYAYGNDIRKKFRALAMLAENPTVSTQVFNLDSFVGRFRRTAKPNSCAALRSIF